jgi:hypothetical protein
VFLAPPGPPPSTGAFTDPTIDPGHRIFAVHWKGTCLGETFL